MDKELRKQNFNDNVLESEALQIQLDFTLLEQLKIAKNLIDLVYGDIWQNTENDDDIKTCNTLTTISLQLKNVINNYDEKDEGLENYEF